MDIKKLATKIVDGHVNGGNDLNVEIAKIASNEGMSVHHTKRLVEEVNKQCYLSKLASSGEQIFDVAQYEKVREIVGTPDEAPLAKKAETIEFTQFSMQKTASSARTEPTSADYQRAIDICEAEIGSAMAKVAELRKCAAFEMPSLERCDMFEIPGKTKGTHIEKMGEEIQRNLDVIERRTVVRNHFMEKRAFIGAAISGTSKVVGGAAKFGIKSPMNRVVAPVFTVQEGVNKAKQIETGKMVSNIPEAQDLLKKADLTSNMKIVLEELNKLKPFALTLGAIGVGTAAARGMGGLAAKMMERRDLDRAFGTITQSNKDIASMPMGRAYFDTIARHSPDLARDPLVAPQVIRNFDTFGGVDLKTVKELREIQSKSPHSDVKHANPIDMVTSANNLRSILYPSTAASQPATGTASSPMSPFFL